MSGMYPNEQILEVFGEQVKWPGLGPDGKFTNGSFTDPLVKPSFIPAETLNLLLDNMQRVIAGAGLNPNNIEPDQLVRAVKALNKKTATFVVGSTAAGHTLADVDYLCTGTNDQTQINAAIQALRPFGGGKVVILGALYSITASVLVDFANVTIEGMGAATVLKRMYNKSGYNGIIHITTNNVTIAHLVLDGNKANYSQNGNIGIYTTGDNCNITFNTCNNNSRCGIEATGSNNKVVGNACNNNDVHGIEIYNNNDNTVIGNSCCFNIYSGVSLSNSSNSTVTGNTCYNNASGIIVNGSNSSNNTVIGNTCYNNANGITVIGINNTVTGNTCCNNASGIIVNGSNSSNNTVIGNTCIRGTGLTTDYSATQYTIFIEAGTNSLIAGNNIMGKNYVNNGGATHTFANNKYN
jgi:parallel beta-helix repeat protein